MSPRWQKGALYEAHGSWHARYYTPEHKQKSKKLCDGDATKKQVNQAFAEFMARVNDEQQPRLSDLSVAKFWDDTYWPFVMGNHKPSTRQGFLQVWEQHLKKHFGDTLLKNYRTSQMTVFLTSLAKEYRPYTLRNIKGLASALFAHAVATGQCETNPIRDAHALGKTLPHGVTGSYTLEEIEDIISALVEHVDCQLIMALAFFLGLRKGEIQGLQWGDVDADFIHIRRNKGKGLGADGKGGLHTDTPKTLGSVRAVPLIAPVRTLLTLWKVKDGDGVWMFTKDLSTLSNSTIRPTLEKAGLEWKGYHSGRRGLGTMLKKLTGNSNAGKNVLGHTTEQTTQQHYEKEMPAEALAGMKLLESKVTEGKQ
jgi:integrase